MLRIDAHAHFPADHPDAVELLDDLDVQVVNVCVASKPGSDWRRQVQTYRDLARRRPDRFAWITAFDVPDPQDPHYHDRVIGQLRADFDDGAVAAKIWKNIGMEARRADGDWLRMDDAIFDPIYAAIAEADRPLMVHTGEPLAAWKPLDEDDPHFAYFSRNPQWHFYGRQDVLDHAEIMAARDAVLGKHPTLRFIGAHLASHEYDVAEVARRLERHENFAVDTSARILDIARQDRAKVRRFFIDFADRILFGTDIVLRQTPGQLNDAEREQLIADLRYRYEAEFGFFSSDRPLHVRGRDIPGLALPAEVVDKLFADNARNWLV